MSYILDAIRKAEDERTEQQTATVYSLQAQAMPLSIAPPQRSYVGLIASVSAALVLSVIGWQYLQMQVYSKPATEATESPNTPLVTEHGQPAFTHQLSANTAIDPEPQLTRVKLWQASSSAQAAIAALDFSFHVYSTQAERRTIIINGQRMSESERIGNELVLQEITAKGVLLRHGNALIDVEILEQW